MSRSLQDTLAEGFKMLGERFLNREDRYKHPPYRYGDGDGSFMAPMIEVPNPRAGQPIPGGVGDYPATMTVYWPWIESDLQKAMEHIKHPKLGPGEFAENIRNLRDGYRY